MLNVVQYQPQNPYNTGGIARTCAIAGARLHLIKPYNFALNRRVNRASMDYLTDVELREHENWEAFTDSLAPNARVFAFTDKGETLYSDVQYQDEDYLLFGHELLGLPPEILASLPCLRIPMPGLRGPRRDHREHSLNVTVSAGVAVFEAVRQLGEKML